VIISEELYDKDFIDRYLKFKLDPSNFKLDGTEEAFKLLPDDLRAKVEEELKKDKPSVLDLTFEDYVRFIEPYTPELAEKVAGVPANDIRKAARWIAQGPTMTFWTMGLNQRRVGVWTNNMAHQWHLITGNIGKPGATPFSITGQPNACGGVRDTGSLSHILPYGRVVKKEEHRKQMEELWGAKPGTIQPKPGFHTVAMFEALGQGKVKAILILTTNPGHSLPNLHKYRYAMEGKDENGNPLPEKPFVVVLDAYPTRTTELADVVLPAAMWSEKEGVYGMSERRYQLLAKVIDPPGEARPDLDILLDFAKRLEDKGVVPAGYISSKFKTVEDVWDEMREVSKDTPYDFMGITRERLHKERGLRWPVPTEDHPGTGRRFVKGEDPLLDMGPFKDDTLKPGEMKFYGHKDGKAYIWFRPARGPAEPVDDEYSFALSTGRVLEHWHTGTMTMKAPELKRAQPEAYVEINPQDAKQLGIKHGDMVKVTSRRGEVTLKARVIDTPRPGMVFVPWFDDRIQAMINFVTKDAYDPGSKQPEFKVCAVKLAKV